MSSTVREVAVEELAAARERGVRVLDLRSPQEYARAMCPGR